MANLMSALPDMGQTDATSARYAEVLAEAMSDGKIVSEEAQELAHVAADEGLGAALVREIHAEFLEGLRAIVLRDQIVTSAELKQLRGAAKALGLPEFFDDLVITKRAAAAAASEGNTSSKPVRRVRCGFCGESGHNRRSCRMNAENVEIKQ